MVIDDQRATGIDPGIRRVCIIGASGKLGRYMVRHCLDRGYEVVGVCREQSVGKLAEFEGRITVVPRRYERPRGDPPGGRGLRWRADRARAVRRPRVRDGNGAGGTRLRGAGRRLVFSCG